MASDLLDAEVDGFRQLNGISSEGRERSAHLIVSLGNLNLLKTLEKEGMLDGIVQQHGRNVTIDDIDLAAYDGNPINVEFKPLNKKSAFFAWDLDELLTYHDFHCRIPDDFFIANLDIRKDDEKIPDEIVAYYHAVEVVNVLSEICDHQQDTDRFVFLTSEKFEIDIKYSAKDLYVLSKISKLKNEIKVDDHHHAQRVSIFVKTLIDILGKMDQSESFCYLLKHFDEIYDRYHRNYQVYAEDFTFEKQMARFSKTRLDLASKIDDVIGSIQNRILAIPLAFVLVAGQLSNGDVALIKNTIIISGALIFSVLMLIMVSNQYGILKHLKSEIDDFRDRYKHKDIFDEVKPKFLLLHQHRRVQVLWLSVIAVIVLVVFSGTTWLYLDYTPKAQELFNKYFSITTYFELFDFFL